MVKFFIFFGILLVIFVIVKILVVLFLGVYFVKLKVLCIYRYVYCIVVING